MPMLLAIMLLQGTKAPDPGLPSLPGMTLLYSFNEADASLSGGLIRIFDLSGNAHQGTASVANAALVSTPGGQGIELSVYHEFVSLYNGGSYPTLGPTWTIQAWTLFPMAQAMVEVTGGNRAAQTLAGNGTLDYVRVDASGFLGCGDWASFHSSGYDIDALDGWHLVSAVGSDGKTLFYIDGENVGSADFQGTGNLERICGGGGFWPAYTWGRIDNFRVLPVARSAAEIAGDAATASEDSASSGGKKKSTCISSSSSRTDLLPLLLAIGAAWGASLRRS